MKKIMGIGLICLICLIDNAFAQTKKADLAGGWYPADAKELSAMLEKYLNAADLPAVEGRIIAIISPHAGLVYSGPVAAYGYKLLSQRKISTIIILGFSHRKYHDGISIYGKGDFQTPLGGLRIDEKTADLIMKKRYSYQELISSVIPKEFSFPGGKVSIVLFSMILH